MHQKPCTDCPFEFQDKNLYICTHCQRRIDYASGQSLSPFPIEEQRPKPLEPSEILKTLESSELPKPLKLSKSPLLTSDPLHTCARCSGEVSKFSTSGMCKKCFGLAGGECRMPGCTNAISLSNKSGLCRDCARIVINRKLYGIKDIYGIVKKRKRNN